MLKVSTMKNVVIFVFLINLVQFYELCQNLVKFMSILSQNIKLLMENYLIYLTAEWMYKVMFKKSFEYLVLMVFL